MEKTDDEMVRMPMWKSYLYHLQQKAPQPKRIVCQREIANKPPFYGREYHGAISREDADFLLTIGGEGSYLIRESQRAPGQYTLAIRFETITKNFKLYYDGQHYVGEKRFDTMQDLVADGLITFYLEDKAADYIAALSNQTNYAESPYVAYNTQKRRHMKTSGDRKSSRRRERRAKSDAGARDKHQEERAQRHKTEGHRKENSSHVNDADKQKPPHHQKASPRVSKEANKDSKSSPSATPQQRGSPAQQRETPPHQRGSPAQQRETQRQSRDKSHDDDDEDDKHDYINQPAVPDRPRPQSQGGAAAASHAPPRPTPRQSRSQKQSEPSPPKQLHDEEILPPPPPSPQQTLQHSDEPLPPPPPSPPLDATDSAAAAAAAASKQVKPSPKSQAKPSPPPASVPTTAAAPAHVAMTADEAVPRVTSSTNTDGPRHRNMSGSSCKHPASPVNSTPVNNTKPFNLKMFEEHSLLTPPGSPHLHSHLFDPALLAGGHKPSSVAWCTDYLEVMGCEKPHNFKLHTFKGPHWCDFCANFLWGLIAQGVKCQDCGFNAHKKCSEKVPSDCMPDMKYVKRMFGVDLTTLVKAQNTLIPAVVETCIKEIEKRGLESEGLYRVAGFHDDIEAIKISFDKDGDLTDISEDKYEDLNTITSVLKLYFRLLPIPLITFDIYFKVIDIIKREELSLENKLNALQHALAQLPPAHYHTLKYLMAHLYRVTEKRQQNKMHAENLATVFSPTLLRSPETDPLTSLTAVKYERELIEILISQHTFIFE